MSNYSMADIAGMIQANNTIRPEHSTSRKGNTDLTMQDFLQLMVVQLQNQTLDDTMDTSEMMNQMVQMQMVTAITNMTETNIMTYASSLVGKVVTVGILNGNNLEEREILVMGTGTYGGQQVIFGHDGNMYYLNQIMAVGYLPNEDGSYDSIQDPTKPPESGNVEQTQPGEGEGDDGNGENPGDDTGDNVTNPGEVE